MFGRRCVPNNEVNKPPLQAKVHSSIAGKRKITDAGFQFLLMDTYSQLWTLLKRYIALAQAMPGTDVNGNVAKLDA